MMDTGCPHNSIYFSDAIGKTATIGVVGKAEYVGTYWNNGTTRPKPTSGLPSPILWMFITGSSPLRRSTPVPETVSTPMEMAV